MCIKDLVGIFGPSWAIKHVFPEIFKLETDTNYLNRLTPLFTIQNISQNCPNEVIKSSFLSSLETLKNDKVPNVRMNVANACKDLLVQLKISTENDKSVS